MKKLIDWVKALSIMFGIPLLLLFALDYCEKKDDEKYNYVEYYHESSNAYVDDDYVEKFDVTKVSMESVDSSALSYVGYKDNKLVIMFNNSPDRCYVYSEVDYDTYNCLMYADSLGSYYNNYIKGKYECERIDDIYISNGHIRYN